MVIGMLYSWVLHKTRWWGRIVRAVLEYMVNDKFAVVYLVGFAGFARSMWVGFRTGEIGGLLFIVGAVYKGVMRSLNWILL